MSTDTQPDDSLVRRAGARLEPSWLPVATRVVAGGWLLAVFVVVPIVRPELFHPSYLLLLCTMAALLAVERQGRFSLGGRLLCLVGVMLVAPWVFRWLNSLYENPPVLIDSGRPYAFEMTWVATFAFACSWFLAELRRRNQNREGHRWQMSMANLFWLTAAIAGWLALIIHFYHQEGFADVFLSGGAVIWFPLFYLSVVAITGLQFGFASVVLEPYGRPTKTLFGSGLLLLASLPLNILNGVLLDLDRGTAGGSVLQSNFAFYWIWESILVQIQWWSVAAITLGALHNLFLRIQRAETDEP
ncbi:hypothetical protein AB1L30_13955 [Bremerella sp. JC817]|uniref:hypothetical protein n=1 Tax=Bremerella sp. JC817 TaxID=3231756 RepID=UPI0034581354